MFAHRRPILLLGFALMFGTGCAMLSSGNQTTQVSYGEQHAAVEKLVPKETPRDEAVRVLEKNGIKGSFGASNSVYYCDTWVREDGKIWPMSISLLFNEEGKLYDFSQEAVPVLE